MTQSNSSGYKEKSGSGNDAGFRAPEKQKKGLSRFTKGALVSLFGAAMLGGGIALSDLTRDESSPTRTFTNDEFNRATVLEEQSLFFGPNTHQYQAYEGYLNAGLIGANDTYVKLSRDMMTVYEVSPAVSNGVQGVKYKDVTANVEAVNYNDRLMIDDYMMAEINSVLRQFPQLNADFDPAIGIVKTADTGNSEFYYHIFRNEDGTGAIRLINNDYRAANADLVDQAAKQMRDMGFKAGIWDHAYRWDAFEAKVYERCAKDAHCEL